MVQEHIADRIARKCRKAALLGSVVSMPVAIFGFGYMAKLLAQTAPVWVTVAVLVSLFVNLLGIASLIDTLQERTRQQ